MRFHRLEEAMIDLVARDLIYPETGDVTLLATAQKFYFGDIKQLPNIDPTAEPFPKLPFPISAFEFELQRTDDYREGWIIIATEFDGYIELQVWFTELVIGWLHAGKITISTAFQTIKYEFDGRIHARADESFKKAVLENFDGLLPIFAVALQVLNCVNVKTETIQPSSALNKKRKLRKKPPVYEYKVLVLRGKTKQRILGGTHSGPRVHLRRGHIKRRKTGNFWWQPHVVGDPARGIVEKEYRADRLVTSVKGAANGDN